MDEQWSLAAQAAARPELEAVVFDAGGTLVRLDFEWLSEMLGELGVRASADELRAAEIAGRRRYDEFAGRVPRAPAAGLHPVLGSVGPGEAYFAAMLEAAGCRHPLLEEALERVRERRTPPNFLWARPMEGARHALDALGAMGVRLACISNSDGRAEQHLVDCGVRDGLEFVIDSQLVGLEKPDPRIFRLALERLGVRAARTLHVGDSDVDRDGARAGGVRFAPAPLEALL